MSHFTVTVRLSAARLKRNTVPDALAKIMEPYCEQTEDRRYLVFKDAFEGYAEEYKTESVEMVKLPNGKLVFPWDEQFRDPHAQGLDKFSQPSAPENLPRVQVSHASRYATLEEFVKQWHGSEIDERTGKYGYWHNPNGFWDWYVIGGRWTGFYPVKSSAERSLGKPGTFNNKPPKHPCSDIVRVRDIDMDFVATETRKRAEEFWAAWSKYVESDGRIGDDWNGPRSEAYSIGLIKVVQGPATAVVGTKALPWGKKRLSEDDERRTWTDIIQLISEDQFMSEYMDAFCPITTFAALDDEGWHQPGKMGWFGCDGSEPDAKRSFQKEFVKRFIKSVPDTDKLVLVDAHV